jgi:hypothetical protein
MRRTNGNGNSFSWSGTETTTTTVATTMSLRSRDDARSEGARRSYTSTKPRTIQYNPYSKYHSFSFSGGSEDDDDDNDNDNDDDDGNNSNNNNNNNNELSDDENMVDVTTDDISKNSHSASGNDDDFSAIRNEKERNNNTNDMSIKENSYYNDASQLTDLQSMCVCFYLIGSHMFNVCLHCCRCAHTMCRSPLFFSHLLLYYNRAHLRSNYSERWQLSFGCNSRLRFEGNLPLFSINQQQQQQKKSSKCANIHHSN